LVEGHREIVSLACNLTTNLIKDGKTSKTDPHCHLALAGSDNPAHDSWGGYPVVGGHLVEGEVAVISEIFITSYPTAINKKDGGELGGSIINLDESQGGIPLN
jgi:predicted DNA-binding protein with PD1-like motif